jgi:hypothetical protein
MKYLITIFSLFILFTNIAFAEQITIVPELLTAKESKEYKEINTLTKQLFTNIETSIDTSKYPTVYNNFPLMKNAEAQNPDLYYVKSDKAELLFYKKTKQLKKIKFQKSETPEGWLIYYPNGNLQSINIIRSKNEVYFFTPTGKFMNTDAYIKAVNKQVKANWEFDSQTIYTPSPIKVVLKINKNGELKKCKVKQGSGIKEIDDSVANAISKAIPFKPFPVFWTLDEIPMMITFEIKYNY